MDKTQQNFAVMFADVAGSTHIYEKLGDKIANEMIDRVIQLASIIVVQHQGVIVKTIGDEIMCRFSQANQAIECACKIHETMQSQPTQNGIVLVFRVGIHWGPALLKEDGDIFGDAVNLAARMAGIAKAKQIITTDITQRNLSDSGLISKCREIDRVKVKGKAEPISIVEVMWEPNDVTRMSTIITNKVNLTSDQQLVLYFQQSKCVLNSDEPAYTFGRDAQCSQTINSTLASRVHAKIENRRGKFILIDESTNGTYLKLGDKPPVFLRREEMILNGRGVISFGEEISTDNDFLLHFSV